MPGKNSWRPLRTGQPPPPTVARQRASYQPPSRHPFLIAQGTDAHRAKWAKRVFLPPLYAPLGLSPSQQDLSMTSLDRSLLPPPKGPIPHQHTSHTRSDFPGAASCGRLLPKPTPRLPPHVTLHSAASPGSGPPQALLCSWNALPATADFLCQAGCCSFLRFHLRVTPKPSLIPPDRTMLSRLHS